VFKRVALPKPSDREKSQLYIQRYLAHFPAAGEIVLSDRSWYNRAGVERVIGFVSDDDSEHFLRLAPAVEREVINNGIILLKYFLDVRQAEQRRRFEARITDPVKHWKLSPPPTQRYDLRRDRGEGEHCRLGSLPLSIPAICWTMHLRSQVWRLAARRFGRKRCRVEAAPFDAIVVAAGGPQVPRALREQLEVGGRLVIPGRRRRPEVLLIWRTAAGTFEEDYGQVAFVPLFGEQGWRDGRRELATDRPDRGRQGRCLPVGLAGSLVRLSLHRGG
jgi:Polyphosphate kinase 2 (PPK2)/Protein-L-isoaspartate(D-aspartate) O-methyltransferase (PCMT)